MSEFFASREEDGDDPAEEEQEETWERTQRKHIFILSSSGKPIYSRYGDEQDMANTFGMIQAVISIAEECEGGISCIKAGDRRIVYFLRGSLYFVAIASTKEPEAVLSKQLEFMYRQVLLTLTSKVQTLLTNNSSRDLRDLLGADTTQLMNAACTFDTVPVCIAFEAVKSFVLEKEARDSVLSYLKESIDKTDAPCALLMFEEHLIAYSLNSTIDMSLQVSDILLLTHFVSNSSSLRRSNDQNWVPVCLPSFNDSAFLQAYVCNLRLPSGGRAADLSLVLLSTSAEPETFSQLHEARTDFERKIASTALRDRIVSATSLQEKHLARYLGSTSVLHFLHKYRPSAGGSPSQFCSTAFQFPLDTPLSKERVLTQYERLALYLRAGSSAPEHTLSSQQPERPNVMCLPPSSDHSLAYAVLNTGYVVVGYATFDTECYATFPGTLTGMECCGRIGAFVKVLRQDLALYQV